MKARHGFLLRAACVLAGCLLLAACQPEGGDLLPLASEGVRVRSTKYKKDVVAQITHGGVTVSTHGRWNVLHHATDFKLEITNTGDAAITVNCNEASVNTALNETMKVSSLAYREGNAAPVSSGDIAPVVIERGQTRELDLGFGIKSQDPKSGAEYLGKTATLRLPVKSGSDAATGTIDFVFAFKYAEHQPEAEQAGTQ